MDFSIYFQPLELVSEQFKKNTLGEITSFFSVDGFPDMDGMDIAIIGVYDDRNAINNKGCAEAPDKVRKYLYELYQGNTKIKIADLGNIFPGNEVKDTYFALSTVIAELIKMKIVPVIIGGGQDLTFANYKAYEQLEQIINLVSVDNSFDLGEAGDALDSNSFLTHILLNQPNFLFNYSNIGYQTYFVNQDSLDLMSKLYFDVHRLGDVRADMREVEPIVRNADVLSFDVSAIRQSDAPANNNATPNGFFGDEACQVMRYAGMSDKLSSIGIYELNPSLDNNDQSVHLVAQMVWYFIDGYSSRKKDLPIFNKKNFMKYLVALDDENKHELVFYKSRKSDRWWMDIPYPPNKGMKYERHHLVPCSYNDYQVACKKEMPDKWWRTYQKLS